MQYEQPEQPRSEAEYRTPPPPPLRERSLLGQTTLQTCLVAGCVTVLVPVLLLGGFFLVMYFVLSSGMEAMDSASLGSIVQSSSPDATLRERVLRAGSAGSDTIAVVSVQGVIDGSGSALDGTGMLGFISAQVRAVQRNKDVKAVIVQIDSPGGGLTVSDEIHHQIETLRDSGMSVLAWAGGSMTSGGYYVAVAAEEIMATPTCTIGSIGVIMQHFQVSELMEKLGVKVDPITSVEHKDLGSRFRDMTPEERAILENFVATAHNRFVAIVSEGRGLPPERVREVADGSIFDPAVALDKRLIDSIGYIEDAVAWAERKTGQSGMRIIGYKRQLSLGDLFSEAGAGAARAAAEQQAPRAMAVWK